jgi:hypothetical protein
VATPFADFGNFGYDGIFGGVFRGSESQDVPENIVVVSKDIGVLDNTMS